MMDDNDRNTLSASGMLHNPSGITRLTLNILNNLGETPSETCLEMAWGGGTSQDAACGNEQLDMGWCRG
jgi:hypothetical protein